MGKWARIAVSIAIAANAVALAGPRAASAYDAGPHAELTRDAMSAEGFGDDAIGVAEVNNWFVDLYQQADSNPFSGHGGFWKRLVSGANTTEHWPDEVVRAAGLSHFSPPHFATDMPSRLATTSGIGAEWDRLRRAVWTLAREARDENNPAKLLAVLGMSLHQLQDFYTHTNWVEPQKGFGVAGGDGPGWRERGYGSSPTWFDVPAHVRDEVSVYADSTHDHRKHETWNTDNNTSLLNAMSKDWPGRPYYLSAATASYFASRQWVQAVRSWVDNEAFWDRALRYRANQRHLDHDLKGMTDISLYAGHWQGQGEPMGGDASGPGGSLVNLRQAVNGYFQASSLNPIAGLKGRSEYRARFERLITRMAEANPTGRLGPVPSSQPTQQSTQFIVLKVLKMHAEGVGDPLADPADMFTRVRVAGQPMLSAVIHSRNDFSFEDPHEPFTWIKAVPTTAPREGEPVESIEVEVRTADQRWAGTDDDVHLRLGPYLRFQLDKRLYNDFERGDRDTYSVPIDEAVEQGMRVGDITRVQIEKSRDGIAGGWKLAGVRLRVNGRTVYSHGSINRWLEDDHRNWIARDFERWAPRGREIPVWIKLLEDDLVYGGDDVGDINPDDKRRTVALGYAPGTTVKETTAGGGRLGGRLDDGDEAKITYRLETLTPETIRVTPPAPPAPPPSPSEKRADLVITAFTPLSATVKNIGPGPAGPFRLRATDGRGSTQVVEFPELPSGDFETVPLSLDCFNSYRATVDYQDQVPETNEENNARDSEFILC